MSAFKAANPGAILEDFVRWHSPRDWLPEDDRVDTPGEAPGGATCAEVPDSWPPRGYLSRQMQADSFWGELWERAECLPVTDQRPLFDHTREAEKVRAARY
jgi:Rab3 GTPase-activating protein catalytic subunit